MQGIENRRYTMDKIVEIVTERPIFPVNSLLTGNLTTTEARDPAYRDSQSNWIRNALHHRLSVKLNRASRRYCGENILVYRTTKERLGCVAVLSDECEPVSVYR